MFDRSTMSQAAGRHTAQALRAAIASRGDARIVAATGASQFEFLDALTAAPDIDARYPHSNAHTCNTHMLVPLTRFTDALDRAVWRRNLPL